MLARYLFTMVLLLMVQLSYGQQSDYIVLKKRNNRTVKTYFTGTFISGKTYGGFVINGIIKDIRNDTIFIQQQDVYQIPTQFGVPALDTVVYTTGIFFREIKQFYFSDHTGIGGAPRRKSFGEVQLPKLLILGGAGYVVLELVNTAYRQEPISDRDKLTGLGIAAGLAAIGFTWQQLKNQSNKAGGQYRVVYVNMSGN